MSEVQLLHLGFGWPLCCFPVDLASRTCLTGLSWAFWIHGRTNVVVISEFGEVVLHSGFCAFHSCALCCDVPHQGSNEGAQCPGRRITGGAESLRGAEKSQQCLFLSESKRKHLTFFRKDLTNFYATSYIWFAASLFVNCQYV